MLRSLFVIVVLVFQGTAVFAQDLPRDNLPMAGFSWAAPGPNWGDGLFGQWHFEDETEWQSTIKPTIVADLQAMLSELGIQSDDERRNLKQLLSIPILIMPPNRISWALRRFAEVSQELDIPFIYKVVGYVWWDTSAECPHCGSSCMANDEYCMSYTEDIDWWGWSSDYVWSHDNPAEVCSGWAATLAAVTWRNWGTPFCIGNPHPRFDSPRFRKWVSMKMTLAAQELSAIHHDLRAQSKAYLMPAIVTENEGMIGHNFHPEANVYNAYGVNTYRLRKCPNDVLDCLPEKPANLTREQWITQKSQEFYRPDDYINTLIAASGAYLDWVSRIFVEAGIPSELLISQSVFDSPFRTQYGTAYVNVSDSALNAVSTPGYSLYSPTNRLISVLPIAQFLFSSRKVRRYALVEYLDEANQNWMQNLSHYVRSDTPTIWQLNIQNWDGRPAQQHTSSINFYNTIKPQYNAAVCGNGAFEYGESCEHLPANLRNPNDAELLLNGTTCELLGFETGTLGCDSNCSFDTSACVAFSTKNENEAPINHVKGTPSSLLSAATDAQGGCACSLSSNSPTANFIYLGVFGFLLFARKKRMGRYPKKTTQGKCDLF
ncbi:MAG: hypothetical protein IPJ88_02475 [Myxococcales bacterium]|nr:MAG: hypothetical protein IPJ88_02475 [Myxococcales bacterium]